MIPSLEGLPTKAKEAPSPHEVRLPHWTPTQYIKDSGEAIVGVSTKNRNGEIMLKYVTWIEIVL